MTMKTNFAIALEGKLMHVLDWIAEYKEFNPSLGVPNVEASIDRMLRECREVTGTEKLPSKEPARLADVQEILSR